MIRVTVYDHKKEVLLVQDSNQPVVTVGRSLEAQIIVPDFRIQEIELSVIRDLDLSLKIVRSSHETTVEGKATLNVEGLTIVITDLVYYSKNSPQKKSEGTYGLRSAFVIGLLALLTIWYDLLSSADLTLVESGKDLLIVCFVLLGGSTLFSGISRIVNGEFSFSKIFFYFASIVLIFAVAATNTMGIRWIFPEYFQYDLPYMFLALVPIGYTLKKLVNVVFASFSKNLKTAIFLFPVTLFFLVAAVLFFPFQSKYKYSTITLRPPLFEIFEVRKKDPDQAMKEISEFIN